MKVIIKNLVADEAVNLLKKILGEQGIVYDSPIVLGELTLPQGIAPARLRQLSSILEAHNLPILTDRKEQLPEQLRHIVREMLENAEPPQENYSLYISRRLGLNYTYIANVFSSTQGFTVEQLIIEQKIEKARQMLLSGQYPVGRIAQLLHYSSIGHFSNQFKKITGKSPSVFKKGMLQ